EGVGAGEKVADGGERFLVQHERDAGGAGEGFAGEGAVRRAEAAAGWDEVAALCGEAEGGDVVVEVVGDGGVPADGDAALGEAAAEPLAVGVEVLAAGDLAADGDDFCFVHECRTGPGVGERTGPCYHRARRMATAPSRPATLRRGVPCDRFRD